jgi:hypothetical protein
MPQSWLNVQPLPVFSEVLIIYESAKNHAKKSRTAVALPC